MHSALNINRLELRIKSFTGLKNGLLKFLTGTFRSVLQESCHSMSVFYFLVRGSVDATVNSGLEMLPCQ